MIHTHIDKIGDKIEEIAASEEEEDVITGRDGNMIDDDDVRDEDDEQVILTSVRDYKPQSNRDLNELNSHRESNALLDDDSPRQNTKYIK